MSLNTACPFCNADTDKIIESQLSFAIYDRFPVNPGHALIIPKRHTANYFELSWEEQADCFALLNRVKTILEEKYHPNGYNIGINVNETAGQTIHHMHIHLIPRYVGDVEEPRGGVRGVIPHKRDY